MTAFLLRQTAGETHQRSLGDRVGPPLGKGVVRGMAADVDHQSSLRAHGRNHGCADLHDTGEIELQQPLPALESHGQEVTRLGSPGIVHQHRWCIALAQKVAHRRCDGSWIGQVDRFSRHGTA